MIWLDFILVTMALLFAVGVLVIPRFKKARKAGCGGCPACPAKSPKPKPAA